MITKFFPSGEVFNFTSNFCCYIYSQQPATTVYDSGPAFEFKDLVDSPINSVPVLKH
jgi:hypothetical protein